jgi:DHA1 family bicyclomycin/chloramphenicol resistance-like MFS transporter
VATLAGALWFGTPLLLAVVCFVVLMTAQGFIGPNGGALASAEVPDHPGTGSAPAPRSGPRLRSRASSR